MSPQGNRQSVVIFPLALLLLCLAPTVALSQGKAQGQKQTQPPAKVEREGKRKGKGEKKEKLFDFTGLQLDGSMRMPQLIYFLDRATEELERASLERRSFVPEMVRSVEEEAL